jgi:ammonium transporter, Amt family
VGLKYRLGFDDSLDVVGVHLVGGLIGTLLIGFFGTGAANPGIAKNGLFYGGGFGLLSKQAIAAFAVMGYSFVGALVIGFLIKVTIGFRASTEVEVAGIDEAEHAESAYEFGGFAGGSVRGTGRPVAGSGPGHAAVLEGSKA